MLEQIIKTLSGEVGSKIKNQTNLSDDNMKKVFSVIGNVTKKEVTGQMTSGGLGNVMNLFSKQPNNAGANLLQSNISSGVISNLTSQLGLSPDISKTIAAVAVPALINLITHKNSATPDDDASPLTELFGGQSSGGALGGIAKNLMGKFLK